MKIGRSLGFAAAILLVVSTWTAANETLWIPAAACNPGFYGSQWSTDLWLYSRVIDETITITATFFSEEPGVMSPPEVLIVLPPNAPLEIRNIVCSLFGERRSGAIRLDSGYPFWAHSWTINRGSGAGIFGQGIPAYSQDDTAPGFTLLGASNRPGPDGVRTNIGIVNTSATTETVNMIARDPDTLELIGIASVEIGAYQWFQANLFDLLGVADQPIELADVSVFPSAFKLVYISRVDNRSGDGTFIFGSSGETISIAGNPEREFEIRTEITYDNGVTIDWLAWPGSHGRVYTRNPESGFQTDIVVVQAPVEYCVGVVGLSGPVPSTVTVSTATKPPGGDWSGGSSSFSTSGNSPIDQEFCTQIE